MLRYRLRFNRLIVVYLSVCLACVVSGSLLAGAPGNATFTTGAILLGAIGPVVVIYFLLNGIFRIQ